MMLTLLAYDSEDRHDFKYTQLMFKDIARMENCDHYLKILNQKL